MILLIMILASVVILLLFFRKSISELTYLKWLNRTHPEFCAPPEEKITLNLNDFNDYDERPFGTHSYGQIVRIRTRLEELIYQYETIEIVIPELSFVSTSFFRGMFEQTILELGKEEFCRRIKFTGKSINSIANLAVEQIIKNIKT